ncbi:MULTISPECIES: hypothetical protein [Pseudomonas]|uniref:hypothetical protein n=1 Tax=Pseudomonas TaxID=286 RepID=UPI00037EA3E7|nr:hypothetical protein [Pseudomonas fluorescens]
MLRHKIKLKTGTKIENAIIEAHLDSLTFIRENGFRKTYSDHDQFFCLAQIRKEFPEIKFLCKGSKLNVFPSRMCSQMSNGSVAYEMTLGQSASFEDIVRTFDYEDENIVKDISEQIAFFDLWRNDFIGKQKKSAELKDDAVKDHKI